MEGMLDVRALADLLAAHPLDEEGHFDDEQQVRPKGKKRSESDVKRSIIKEEVNTVKEDKEFEDIGEASEVNDWKKRPEWNITYKQQVTPSDLFLQMSGKTQLTSSCEDMIITIDLPGEQGKNVDVKITETTLDLLSPIYRLSVPLPHRVDPKKQREAKWYPEEEKLKLTLTMAREFDYINF